MDENNKALLHKLYGNVQEMLKYSELKITTIIGINLMSVTFLSSFAKNFWGSGRESFNRSWQVHNVGFLFCTLSFLMFFLSIFSALFALWPRYLGSGRGKKNYLFFRDIAEAGVQDLENVYLKGERYEWEKDIILSIQAISKIVCTKNISFFVSSCFLFLGIVSYLILLFIC